MCTQGIRPCGAHVTQGSEPTCPPQQAFPNHLPTRAAPQPPSPPDVGPRASGSW